MKKFYRFETLFIILLLSMIGCGNPSVTGTVKLPDGSPVTMGQVYFENGNTTARGTIQEDGSFKMGQVKDGDGVPLGTYKVAIMGAIINKFPENEAPAQGGLGIITVRKPIEFTELIDHKYSSVSTSGLEVEVKGSMKHDIIVEPPPE